MVVVLPLVLLIAKVPPNMAGYRRGRPYGGDDFYRMRVQIPAGGWWLVAGGWWLVAGGWF